MAGRHFHTCDHAITRHGRTGADVTGSARERVAYQAHVALVLLAGDGDRTKPILADAREISVDGITIVSRQMLHPGATGAMQMLRADGRLALVGVEILSSTYVGNMEHVTACRFSPLPESMPVEDFLDDDGRLQMLDDRLRENRCDARPDRFDANAA